MPSTIRRFVAALSVAGLTMAAAGVALADGIISFPARIEVENGFRGSTYERSIAFVNDFDTEGQFELRREGEIAEWTTVFDLEGNPVESVVAPPRAEVELQLRIDVPSDAANGEYLGDVGALLIQPSDAAEGVDPRFGVLIPIRIVVTGEQVLDGTFLELIVSDGEVGLPLRVTAVVRNSGNVVQRPAVTFEVVDADGEVVESSSPSVDAVPPEQTQELIFDWDTSQERPGPYTARVSVAFGQLDLGTLEASFELAPRGTLTRSGEFISLRLDGPAPEPGGVARVLGEFSNTGEIESRVQLVGQLSRDGTLVAPITTPPSLVLPGEVKTLEAFIDVDEPGMYELRARMNFEGTETDEQVLSFEVTEPAPVAEGSSLGLVLGIVGGLLVIGGGAAFWYQRRHRTEAPSRPIGDDHATERVREL